MTKEQTLWDWLSELWRQHQRLTDEEGRLFLLMDDDRRRAIRARKEVIEADTDRILGRIEEMEG